MVLLFYLSDKFNYSLSQIMLQQFDKEKEKRKERNSDLNNHKNAEYQI